MVSAVLSTPRSWAITHCLSESINLKHVKRKKHDNFLAAAVLPLLLFHNSYAFTFGRRLFTRMTSSLGLWHFGDQSRSELIKLLRFWKKFYHICYQLWIWLSVTTLLRISLLHQSWFQVLYIFRFGVYLSFLGWLWQTFPQLSIVTRSMYWLSGALFAMIALAIYLIFPDMRSLISLGGMSIIFEPWVVSLIQTLRAQYWCWASFHRSRLGPSGLQKKSISLFGFTGHQWQQLRTDIFTLSLAWTGGWRWPQPTNSTGSRSISKRNYYRG